MDNIKPMSPEEMLKKFDQECLIGIDQCECDTEEGWWETSDGVGFGKEEKEKAIRFIKRYLASVLLWARDEIGENKIYDTNKSPETTFTISTTVYECRQTLTRLAGEIIKG
jgi:O-succinylbenzoate synthase